MLVWDNQQATSWLAGIIEGEGSFSSKNGTYSAISIPNNDLDIINECERFLTANCIFFNTYVVNAGKKIGYVIYISMQDCKILYNHIIDKLQCRSKEYQKIMGASETERELTIDCHWLAGIFEAEGAFFIGENHRGHLTPRIELDNTNDKIIDKIVKNLHSFGCSGYVKDYTPEKRKPYTKITIQGVRRCSRFLEKVTSWRSKRILQKATILSDYCNSRMSKPQKAPYDSKENTMVLQLRQLNS